MNFVIRINLAVFREDKALLNNFLDLDNLIAAFHLFIKYWVGLGIMLNLNPLSMNQSYICKLDSTYIQSIGIIYQIKVYLITSTCAPVKVAVPLVIQVLGSVIGTAQICIYITTRQLDFQHKFEMASIT